AAPISRLLPLPLLIRAAGGDPASLRSIPARYRASLSSATEATAAPSSRGRRKRRLRCGRKSGNLGREGEAHGRRSARRARQQRTRFCSDATVCFTWADAFGYFVATAPSDAHAASCLPMAASDWPRRSNASGAFRLFGYLL